ncbi:hypothetical protein TD95_002177 [Thielaviopsis punctulata]|uniref:Beta-mannosidase B n=1 Tax=Thielaviopsis punctulata TaxID=72032 RepID=A0A0F4ZG19_9PEZI|nr:hypothetical protein TD95_002177 [Thielaviopsis punctulata]
MTSPSTARISIPLHSGWHFREVSSTSSPPPWLPVAQFPTTIHLDLFHHGLIPDPFLGTNERAVQWVGERTWAYTTSFSTPAEMPADARAEIVFAGLDTLATVRVNGVQVLRAENMFTPHVADVSRVLRPAGDGAVNTLEIEFESAFRHGKKIVEALPEHKWGCWNGDVSRLAVRKAQYHWGWDWGPMLMTCGPWRPVTLNIWTHKINDLAITSSVDLSGSSPTASVTVTPSVSSTAPVAAGTHLKITLSHASYSATLSVPPSESAVFSIPDPQLWYPVRYGAQPLYTVTATLCSPATTTVDKTSITLDTATKRIGLRTVDLVQAPLADQPGTSFFFRVNNVPVFCGGSNWIPGDSMLPRMTPETYRSWLALLVAGNQTMVRVWGGGVYEDDAFYDICDEFGILVWQDFMFACGNYPAQPDFLASVEAEARANVTRLRHHASIVVWAGNNEDYQYRESVSLTYDPKNTDAESWLKTDFPARYIYEKVLADVCAELMPETAYRFGCPFGGAETSDQTIGDIHQWNVWHGTQEKYQNFDQLSGRFVSEFGMEAFPHISTIDALLPAGTSDADRYAQSATMDFHNKAEGHERRLALYLVENIRYAPDPLEAYVYSTQLMQAECLSTAYRLWKREWRGPGREYCAGALVWQLNDCWPGVSWSIADYFGRPKLAYYAIKREMADLSVGMKREADEVQIWASNLKLAEVRGTLSVKAYDVETGAEVHVWDEESIVLPGNQSTEITAVKIPKDAERTVVAGLLSVEGEQVARYVNWPEPLKYLHLQQPKSLSVVVSKDGKRVDVSADVPVKGLMLECADENVVFGDNGVDIVPGDVVQFPVTGVSSSSIITARFLNK